MSRMTFPGYEDLSLEQDEVYNLPLDGKSLVSGPPGTGKSVMALYRAQALSIDDRTPAILMFNNVLKQYIALHAAKLGVADGVETFHCWFRREATLPLSGCVTADYTVPVTPRVHSATVSSHGGT